MPGAWFSIVSVGEFIRTIFNGVWKEGGKIVSLGRRHVPDEKADNNCLARGGQQAL